MSQLRILHVVPYFEHAWAYGGIPRLASAMTHALAARGHHVTVCTTDACDEHVRVSNGEHVRVSNGEHVRVSNGEHVRVSNGEHVRVSNGEHARVSNGEHARVSNGDHARVSNDEPTATPGGDVHVRVFRNISNRLAYHWQFFTPLGLASFLRREAGRFDIAHLHACRNLPGVIAARYARRAGVPYLLSPNGTAPVLERRMLAKRAFDKLGGQRVLDHAARIVAVTSAERRQLLGLGVRPDRVAVVANPVDENEFLEPPDPDAFRAAHALHGRPIVLFLGKLTPRKGVDVLLHAMGQVGTAGAALVVAGNDMGAGGIVSELTRTLRLEDRVVRVGLLRGRQRLDALAAADVVVYPSRDEIFGLVPLEALLCGTPVVVSNDSGCGEVIGRTGGGHMVPYGEAATLAGAIDDVLAHQARWRARASKAAARARVLFGSAVVSQQMEELYREVLGQRAAGRRS